MERNRNVPGKKGRMFSQQTNPSELQTAVSVRRIDCVSCPLLQ